MPHETTGKWRKLTRPFFGLYHIIELHMNGVTVQPVDRPKDSLIQVNLDWITLCQYELPNASSLG